MSTVGQQMAREIPAPRRSCSFCFPVRSVRPLGLQAAAADNEQVVS